MVLENILLAAAKVLVLLLGTVIAGLTLLAYRRIREELMLYLGIGFSLLAFGSSAEGVLFELFWSDLLAAHIVESVFVLTGLGTIAALLRPRRSCP
ncbi:MAG: hypothetical protein ACE5JL_03825 [Dehalococcoidia bacterium]